MIIEGCVCRGGGGGVGGAVGDIFSKLSHEINLHGL